MSMPNLFPTTIHYGTQALDALAETWGETITPIPEYTEAQQRLEAFAKLLRATTPDATELLEAPLEKWGDALDKCATLTARNIYLNNIASQANTALDAEANTHMRSPRMVLHVVKQLPVADTFNAFKEAARALGDNIHDMQAAIEQGQGDTYQTFINTGRKIAALMQWAGQLNKNYRTAVIFQPNELPPLKRSLDTIGWNKGYSENDYHQHRRLIALNDITNTEDGLYTLATSETLPGKTTPPATLKDLNTRVETIRNAGAFTEVSLEEVPRKTQKLKGTRVMTW